MTNDPSDDNAAGAALGRVAGWAMAPFFGLVSFARHARTFHPRGPIFHARASVDEHAPPELAHVARRLAGPAIVRFSGALWKDAEDVQDVLGCAVRFRHDDGATAAPSEDDQDLLFATIRRPYTMAFAPLTTNVSDYLGNDYFAVSPFDVGIGARIYLRLHPASPSSSAGDSRGVRILRDVARGDVPLRLEYAWKPFGPWLRLATITLERAAHIDGEALRFEPFRSGRDIRPRGFIHALRAGVYTLSQWARPAHAEAHAPAAALR